MKRGIIAALAVLAGWWGGANFAGAQGLAPGFGSSPFYPLGGTTARVHPFGPIQMQPLNPQFAELQQSLNRLNTDGLLRGQVDPLGNNVNALGGMQTGHATTFFNSGHYFPATSTGGSGGSGLGANPQGTGFGGYSPLGFYGAGNLGGTKTFNSGTMNAAPGIR
jgi:hypothetical protein